MTMPSLSLLLTVSSFFWSTALAGCRDETHNSLCVKRPLPFCDGHERIFKRLATRPIADATVLYSGMVQNRNVRFLDVNGDGILDLIGSEKICATNCGATNSETAATLKAWIASASTTSRSFAAPTTNPLAHIAIPLGGGSPGLLSAPAIYYSPKFAIWDVDSDGHDDIILRAYKTSSVGVGFDFTCSGTAISVQQQQQCWGQFAYRVFKNNGATLPAIRTFTEMPESQNPLWGLTPVGDAGYVANWGNSNFDFYDVDNDGVDDFFFIDVNSDLGINVLRNVGMPGVPQFATKPMTEKEGNPFTKITSTTSISPVTTFADINNDGAKDLLFGDAEGTQRLRVWMNDGSGGFPNELIGRDNPFAKRVASEIKDKVVGQNGLFASFGDVNGDGLPDLLTSQGKNGGRVEVYLNSPSGAWSPGGTGTGPANPWDKYVSKRKMRKWQSPAFGDMNGDGKVDMVNSVYADVNGFRTKLYFYMKKADYMWEEDDGIEILWTTSASAVPQGLRIFLVDVDNDGDLDILAGARKDASNVPSGESTADIGIFLLENKGGYSGLSSSVAVKTSFLREREVHPFTSLVFSDAKQGGEERTFLAVAMHDVNADGKLDLVVGYCLGEGEFKIAAYINQGALGATILASTFAAEASSSFGHISGSGNKYPSPSLAFADIDADGHKDLVIAYRKQTSQSLGAEWLHVYQTYKNSGASPPNPALQYTTLMGVDTDTSPFAEYLIKSNAVNVWQSSPYGTIGKHPTVAFHDVNLDGMLDFIVGDAQLFQHLQGICSMSGSHLCTAASAGTCANPDANKGGAVCSCNSAYTGQKCAGCAAGYQIDTATSCKQESCGIGTYLMCLNATSSVTACWPGESAGVASPTKVECQACPLGHHIASSSHSMTECVACDLGKYANDAGSSECKACPVGRVTGVNYATTECAECSLGYVPDSIKVTCSACLAGKFRTSGEGGWYCGTCESGKVSFDGSEECWECALGDVPSPTQGMCDVCEEGKYANAGDTVCSKCTSTGLSCANGILKLLPDYWYDANDGPLTGTSPIFECIEKGVCTPVNPTAATGNISVTVQCPKFATGPLCADCVHSYVPSSGGACEECNTSSDQRWWDKIVLLIICGSLFFCISLCVITRPPPALLIDKFIKLARRRMIIRRFRKRALRSMLEKERQSGRLLMSDAEHVKAKQLLEQGDIEAVVTLRRASVVGNANLAGAALSAGMATTTLGQTSGHLHLHHLEHAKSVMMDGENEAVGTVFEEMTGTVDGRQGGRDVIGVAIDSHAQSEEATGLSLGAVSAGLGEAMSNATDALDANAIGENIEANLTALSHSVKDVGESVRQFIDPGQIKLLIGNLQINASISIIFDVPWPKEFLTFLSALSIVKLDLFSWFSIAAPCLHSTHFMGLASFIAAPLVLIVVSAAALGTSLLINVVYHRACPRSVHIALLNNRCGRYLFRYTPRSALAASLKVGVLLLLFIYPTICSKVFMTFKCIDLNYGDNTVSYMLADMSVQCYSNRWWGWAVVAIFAMAFYIIGIPFGLLILLGIGQKRGTLYYPKAQIADETNPTIEEVEANVSRTNEFFRNRLALSTLYAQYDDKYWWFESVLLLRKMILTGALALFGEENSMQLLAALVTCVAWICLTANLRPFRSVMHLRLAQIEGLQLLFTLLVGLVLKLSPEWTTNSSGGTSGSLAAVLIILNIIVISLALMQQPIVRHAVSSIVMKIRTRCAAHFGCKCCGDGWVVEEEEEKEDEESVAVEIDVLIGEEDVEIELTELVEEEEEDEDGQSRRD